MGNWRNYSNYFIVAICSLLITVFLPMLGTTVGLGWNVPTTAAGWIVWSVTKGCVALLSIIILKAFLDQGRKNSLNNDNYIEALRLLNQYKINEEQPVGPNAWHRKVFMKKGTTMCLTSLVSTVAISQALLTFDYIALISYLLTVTMNIIFGIFNMQNAEDYWQREFLLYAKKVTEEK